MPRAVQQLVVVAGSEQLPQVARLRDSEEDDARAELGLPKFLPRVRKGVEALPHVFALVKGG